MPHSAVPRITRVNTPILFALVTIACAILIAPRDVAGLQSGLSPTVSSQRNNGSGTPAFRLDSVSAELNARLIGVERAQGVLLGALLTSNGMIDEADLLQRMMRRVSDLSASARPDPEAERGFAAIGARGAEIIRRTHAFHREVLAIVASLKPAERKRAIDAALERYRSLPQFTLPDAAKDMTILYDHPYTSFVPPGPGESEPRRQLAYPTLTGFMWSAHWYELAVHEPLETSFEDPAGRDRGLATVAERFRRKLSSNAPPDAFPTELPLAPSIAPGLVALHDRAASIVDNLDLMLDVLTDVLVHPNVADRRLAVSEVIAQFSNREYRCVQTDEWIVVALRHSIFEQGGPALGTMTANERNAFFGGHGQHYVGRRAPPPCEAE
jgi:hypothetical protein